MRLLIVYIASLLILIPLWCHAEIQLQQQMDEKTFRSTGLERLTPEELVLLNTWLNTHLNRAEQSLPVIQRLPEGDEAFGMEHIPEKVAPYLSSSDVMQSIIPGNFRGWSGNTVFKLENGQAWRQMDSSRFYFPVKDPVVTIEKGAMGAYYLRVEGKGTVVRVRRIE